MFGAEPGAGFRTTFEHLTALALVSFQDAGLDRAVIEVGLGGRLDATNVILPGPAVMTPISLDHRHVLGKTVGAIAADKAHIFKPGGSAFIMPQRREAWAALRRRLEGQRIPYVTTTDRVTVERVRSGEAGSTFHIRGEHHYGPVATRLLGEHQSENVAAAVAVAESLLPSSRRRPAIEKGLRGVLVPARMEPVVVDGRRFLVDGGHNPAAGRAVARGLALHYPGRHVTAVIGMARDKDHRSYLASLDPVVDSFVFTRAGNVRAADPERLRERSPRGGTVSPTAEGALLIADRARADIVLVAGSFLLAAECLRALRRRG
jgi:dihydrofolate synthase/folylpolyglutamate synthase